MSGIFPLRQTVTPDRGEPRLVDLDDETADEVFAALSAETTRQIFVELHQSPQAASDLATVTDTSVQNVQYHLQKLTEADLVEVVDTWYSERGTEMKVYAPTDESLVLFAGSDKGSSLRTLLKRVVGVVGVLLPASAFVGWLAHQLGSGGGDSQFSASGGLENYTVETSADLDAGAVGVNGTGATPDGSTAVPDPSTTLDPDVLAPMRDTVDVAANAVADPGLAAGLSFLLGGLFVVLLLVVFVSLRS